jgi:hypothetical protein
MPILKNILTRRYTDWNDKKVEEYNDVEYDFVIPAHKLLNIDQSFLECACTKAEKISLDYCGVNRHESGQLYAAGVVHWLHFEEDELIYVRVSRTDYDAEVQKLRARETQRDELKQTLRRKSVE